MLLPNQYTGCSLVMGLPPSHQFSGSLMEDRLWRSGMLRARGCAARSPACVAAAAASGCCCSRARCTPGSCDSGRGCESSSPAAALYPRLLAAARTCPPAALPSVAVRGGWTVADWMQQRFLQYGLGCHESVGDKRLTCTSGQDRSETLEGVGWRQHQQCA